MRRTHIILLSSAGIFLAARLPAPSIIATDAQLSFPDAITFSVRAESSVELTTVELEYGVDIQSCGADVTRVTPEDFEPARSVDLSWRWNMRETGSLPPGAQLWWRWHLVDAAGAEVRTETQQLTWLDDEHPWRTLSADGVNLHWYAGADSFAQLLLDSATAAKAQLATDLGAQPTTDVNLYIYGAVEAMRDAVLFEPQWTGGQAYYDHNIVILGINDENQDWGRGAIAHEMAHIVVRDIVSNCFSALPTWLDEGLAVYAEGGLDSGSQAALDEARADDRLYSVRSLSDGFGEHPAAATVSYAQSYSLVAYLIDAYGQERILELLQVFQAGYRYEAALEQVYGLTVEQLESDWRAAIGASPASSAPGRDAAPTPFPTFVPYSRPPVAATTSAPTAEIPTVQPTALPDVPPNNSGNILRFGLLACCALIALLGLFAIGMLAARRKVRG